MRNKVQVWLGAFVALLLLGSCQSESRQSDGVWMVDVRSAIQKETPFSMKEDVTGIEYIPLETTDSCLISNIVELIMDDDFIFVHNGKTDRIFQFTPQGKFVRQLGMMGNGPGEYAPWTVENLALNSRKKEIFLHRRRLPALVYSYSGAYLRTDTTLEESVGNRYLLKNGSYALAGVPITPFEQSPWLAALKDKENRLVATKAPFPAQVPADACYMQEVQFVPFRNSAIAYTLCNDTLFRISESGIAPACIYAKKNGAEYNEKIANINELAKDDTNTSSTIELFNFFETPRYLYFRTALLTDPNKFFIQRLDKQTGEFLSHAIAQDFMDVSIGFSDSNVMGLDNDLDGGVPFCPSFVYKDRVGVQAVNAVTIAKLENKGYLKNKPAGLQVGEFDNPVIIVYTFKN